MKYFTPAMVVRMQSLAEQEIEKAHAAWEHAVDRYEQRLHKIRPKLPKPLRYLLDSLYLHDADVLSVAHNGERFVIVLQMEVAPKELVVVTYTLAGKPVVNFAALPRKHCTGNVQWMYDEVDIVPRGKLYSHEILFSNGWHVRLRFRDVQVVVAQRLLQQDTRPPQRRPAMAQPA